MRAIGLQSACHRCRWRGCGGLDRRGSRRQSLLVEDALGGGPDAAERRGGRRGKRRPARRRGQAQPARLPEVDKEQASEQDQCGDPQHPRRITEDRGASMARLAAGRTQSCWVQANNVARHRRRDRCCCRDDVTALVSRSQVQETRSAPVLRGRSGPGRSGGIVRAPIRSGGA